MSWFFVLFIVFVAGWFVLPRLRWIGAVPAAQKLKAGAVLLDVRTPTEYKGAALPGSRNIPLGALVQGVHKKGLKPDQPLLVYCASGMRSASAVRQLKALGYQQVWNLGSYGRARTALAKMHTD